MTETRAVQPQRGLLQEVDDAVFRLARLLDRQMAIAVAPERMTALAGRVLCSISAVASQRELGAALGLGPAQVSVTVSELVERKLVERKGDTGDHRLRRPQLTAKGRAAVGRIGTRLARESAIGQALDERQLRTLLKTLRRIEDGTR